MYSAAPAVYFDDSDDEDYVSFDEEELNKGIGDLYDDDSASDYNDDVEDEEEVDLDEIEIEEAALQENYEIPQAPQQQQQQHQQSLQGLNYSDNPYPTPKNANNNAVKEEKEKKKRWSLFGNKKQKEEESRSEAMVNKSMNISRSAFAMGSIPSSAPPRPQRAQKRAKKEIKTCTIK